jgi:hypothetical protein
MVFPPIASAVRRRFFFTISYHKFGAESLKKAIIYNCDTNWQVLFALHERMNLRQYFKQNGFACFVLKNRQILRSACDTIHTEKQSPRVQTISVTVLRFFMTYSLRFSQIV